jgi:hypothetical protein
LEASQQFFDFAEQHLWQLGKPALLLPFAHCSPSAIQGVVGGLVGTGVGSFVGAGDGAFEGLGVGEGDGTGVG